MSSGQARHITGTRANAQDVLRPLGRRLVALRVGFGIVWAVDAFLKWQPAFVNTFGQSVAKGAQSQPAWLSPWFEFWKSLIGSDPHLFAYAAAAIETLIALCLILGVGRGLVYLGGAVWSLGIWSVPEGFGPVLVPGTTDIGAAIMYALIFVALYWLESAYQPRGWTLDAAIRRRLPSWRRIGEPGGNNAVSAPANFSPAISQLHLRSTDSENGSERSSRSVARR